MIRFAGLLALVAFGFWLYALFDSITAPRERIRLLPKPVWVIVIVVLNIVGTVLWFTVGRPRKSDLPPAPPHPPRAQARPAPGSARRPRARLVGPVRPTRRPAPPACRPG